MKWLIIDGNDIEEDVEIDSIEELREWAEDMLNDYYELYSEYGNPIYHLMLYIPDDNLVSLIKDYNWIVEVKE